jgi:diguanylate cyclase (GGDEF)-like protein/PAS domain S-box-containing protein
MGLPEENQAATPPPPAAAQSIAYILQGYPGPALHMDGAQVAASNAAGASLLPLMTSVWGELFTWMERGPRSPLLLKLTHDEMVNTWEWNAIILPSDQLILLGRNISMENNLTAALTESRDRFKDLIELSADLAWETDSKGRFVYVAGAVSLGYKPEDLVGQVAGDFTVFRPESPTGVFETREAFHGLRTWMRRKDGSEAEVMVTAKPLRTGEGQWRGARGVCHDVTEQMLRQQELALAQRRDRMIAELAKNLRDAQQAEVALVAAAKAIQTSMKASGCTIYAADVNGDLRFAAEAGLSPPELVHSYNRKLHEYGQSSLHERMSANSLIGTGTWANGKLNGAIWVWRASEDGIWGKGDEQLMVEVADHVGIALAQFDYRERLRVLSECDALTKLLNRRAFMEQLGEKLSAPRPGGSALFYLDLDNFKQVNDKHGHQRGDMVIKRLGEILHQIARPGDLAGRIGGDEFVLWLDNVEGEAVGAMAERIVSSGIALRDLSASPELPLGISAGVAVVEPGQARRAISLLQLADNAMYNAKKAGKSSWSLAKELKF